MSIEYKVDAELKVREFLQLAQRVWPGDYDSALLEAALKRTTNITARDGGHLVGCVRLLSDGYLFSTIPEIMVQPDYQGQGIGRRLMELAYLESPTSLFLGAQPGNEGFFEKAGFERSVASFAKRKQRPQASPLTE